MAIAQGCETFEDLTSKVQEIETKGGCPSRRAQRTFGRGISADERRARSLGPSPQTGFSMPF
jgi:hypothetical protein